MSVLLNANHELSVLTICRPTQSYSRPGHGTSGRGRPPMDLRGLAPRTSTGTSTAPLPQPSISGTAAGLLIPREKRIKCNEPSLFTGPPMDVRLWVIDLNHFFNLQLIEGSATQASTACTYLGPKIRTRTQLMRLSGHRGTFEDWDLLQAWLLENHSVGDVGLDAELKMERVRMSVNESVQDFINRFETIITDPSWNDAAVCHAFWRKLSADIVDRVQQSHLELPDTFVGFERVAQQAKNHFSI